MRNAKGLVDTANDAANPEGAFPGSCCCCDLRNALLPQRLIA